MPSFHSRIPYFVHFPPFCPSSILSFVKFNSYFIVGGGGGKKKGADVNERGRKQENGKSEVKRYNNAK
jgi:hypothetical protein